MQRTSCTCQPIFAKAFFVCYLFLRDNQIKILAFTATTFQIGLKNGYNLHYFEELIKLSSPYFEKFMYIQYMM